MTAQMLGRGLRLHLPSSMLHRPVVVYSSPALRCVQTAQHMIKGLALPEPRPQINVEPALFEWAMWYKKTPEWMTPPEISRAGMAVDISYASRLTVDQGPEFTWRKAAVGQAHVTW